MASCTHNCETCGVQGCGSRGIKKLVPNKKSKIGKVIAVMSGKGGVGKSMVTSLLAASLANKGHSVAILDADVTGPSIPKAFGVEGTQIYGDEDGKLIPAETPNGIKIISANLLTETSTTPIIWRGSLISSMVSQFFTDVAWGEVEYLLIDMPPGTGDVPLTVFQSVPVDGAIVVASPQDLVSMIVEKSINMANMMKINILGLVENMAYALCPCCGERINIFGKTDIKTLSENAGVELLAELPIDPTLTALADAGKIYGYCGDLLDKAVEAAENCPSISASSSAE